MAEIHRENGTSFTRRNGATETNGADRLITDRIDRPSNGSAEPRFARRKGPREREHEPDLIASGSCSRSRGPFYGRPKAGLGGPDSPVRLRVSVSPCEGCSVP